MQSSIGSPVVFKHSCESRFEHFIVALFNVCILPVSPLLTHHILQHKIVLLIWAVFSNWFYILCICIWQCYGLSYNLWDRLYPRILQIIDLHYMVSGNTWFKYSCGIKA